MVSFGIECSGWLICRGNYKYKHRKIKNEVFDLFQVKEELLWKLPLIAVLLFLGELAAITIYQKYRELQREKENYFVEQQQIKAMKLRLEEAENFYGSIRKVRHEMKIT